MPRQPPRERGFRYAKQNRCFLLMVSLISTLATAPWLENVRARALIAALTTASFASAIHAVAAGGATR